MVIEEKFVGKHDVPALLAVGLEGVFGFSILSLLLIPMYHIPPVDNSTNRFEVRRHHRRARTIGCVSLRV